ncbi:hypothetical protein [Actinoplanes sp. L3-i22]|uniref:hypothetical protein n=1 Tax=Actinoplanes sp. L3-i22 TaxID=2836373 RepID=UPI001C74D9C7|nr:hypothetical protein [Actinoplanes sp. L3-i22]BCY10167.1 hypothetical protein L3i22_052550 [Actinoplanes sp. L3-i22]
MTMPDRAEILALLRQLDDPDHLEHPATFDNAIEQRRFRSLVSELERRFACTCRFESEREIQDASHLGQVVIPASATTESVAIFVRVSNFGRLALLGAENPGCYDDADTLTLIGGPDLDALLEILAELTYVPLLEDVLNTPYDGASVAPTWFVRYFDFL